MLSKLRYVIKRRRVVTFEPAAPEFLSIRGREEGLLAFLERSQREADQYFAQFK